MQPKNLLQKQLWVRRYGHPIKEFHRLRPRASISLHVADYSRASHGFPRRDMQDVGADYLPSSWRIVVTLVQWSAGSIAREFSGHHRSGYLWASSPGRSLDIITREYLASSLGRFLGIIAREISEHRRLEISGHHRLGDLWASSLGISLGIIDREISWYHRSGCPWAP